MQHHDTIPYGFCHCGCGQRTTVPKTSNRPSGRIAGVPQRFIKGHGYRRVSYIVDSPTGCWNWNGALAGNGYPVVNRDGRVQYAHRWHYEQYFGKIPDGLVLDHLCSNPRCVNPEHLEPVTQRENVHRSRSSPLTMEIANAIRAECGNGLTRQALADKFGVSIYSVTNICLGRRWRPE